MTTSDAGEKGQLPSQPSEQATPKVVEVRIVTPYAEHLSKFGAKTSETPASTPPEPVPVPVEDAKAKKNWKWALVAEVLVATAKIAVPDISGEQGPQHDPAIVKVSSTEHTTKHYVAIGSDGADEAAREADRFWTAIGPVIDAIAKEQRAPESKIQEAKDYLTQMAKGAGDEFRDPYKLGHKLGNVLLEKGAEHAFEEVITLTVAGYEADKLKKGGAEKKNEILSGAGEVVTRADKLLAETPGVPAHKIAEECHCSEEMAETVKKSLDEVRKDSARSANAWARAVTGAESSE